VSRGIVEFTGSSIDLWVVGFLRCRGKFKKGAVDVDGVGGTTMLGIDWFRVLVVMVG